MKKVFISIAMNGKIDEEIHSELNEIKTYLTNNFDEELVFIDSFVDESYDEKHPGLKYLSKSIELLDEADLIFMTDKWWLARGCHIEYYCALSYGVGIIGFVESTNEYPKLTLEPLFLEEVVQ